MPCKLRVYTSDDIDEVFAHSIIIASSSMISSFGKSHQHTYEITDTGIFKLNKHWISDKDLPNFSKTVFGRFGQRTGPGLRFFPYGFYSKSRVRCAGYFWSPDGRMFS